jgi:type IX secretion system PorP/SprF family membrane protein
VILPEEKIIVLLTPGLCQPNNNILIFSLTKYWFSNRCYRILRILPVILCLIVTTEIRAQQNSAITHYMFMNMAFNPAFAGSSDGINVTGLVREQWIGFKDDHGGNTAPQTLFLTIDSPIKFLHGGVGGTIINDKIGPYNNTQLNIAYAYRADMGAGVLSAGAQLNLLNATLNSDKIEPDIPISNLGKNAFVADASFGVFYKVPDKYSLGFACNNILQTQMKLLISSNRRYFVLSGGYNWVVPNHPAYEFQPSALIYTDLAAFSFSVSGLLQYNKKFWGGLGYRYEDCASFLVGFNVKAFKVGISYDVSTSKKSRYEDGTVEVMVNYCFKIETEKFRKSYKNTRFL